MGEFAGWEVPMLYTSSMEEHLTVRTSVGIFDVSHMGRLHIKGSHSLDLLQKVFTKDISKTKDGFMSGPTLALNIWARVRDDEMPYKISEDEWLLVPNATYTEKMKEHLNDLIKRYDFSDVIINDLTEEYVMLAIQGPKAVEAMEKIGASWVNELKPLQFLLNKSLGDINTFLVSRSGWTGEDGFEVWLKPKEAIKLYRKLLSVDVKPVGIISRDTLRIEMGFVLGGNEYGEDPTTWPCALSLRYGMGAIDWKKKGYEGYEALHACRREGVRWIRIGFVMKKKFARMIPRHGYKIVVEDQVVGWVTSGTFSPVRKRALGMGYMDTRYAIIGEVIEIEDNRGRRGEARIEEFPLIKR